MRAIATCILALVAALSPAADWGSSPASRFDTYRVPVIAEKRAAPLQLLTSQDREYRTVLTEAYRGPVNFAGHYILATIGCGALCVLTAALDRQTGSVTWLPFTVCCWNPPIGEPFEFRADSALLVVHGQRNEQGLTGPHYYRLSNSRFEEIR